MITVGYVETAVSVFESDGVVQLTVAISTTNPSITIESSFLLLVNTNDGTATAAGLSSCLEFYLHTVHTSLPLSHNYSISRLKFCMQYINAHSLTTCNKQHTTHTLTYIHAITTHNTYALTHIQSHISVAPSDYDALTDFPLAPFSNYVRQLSFNMSIVNNMLPEENEDFTARLTLSPADQARLGNRVTVQPNVATVTILDDHGKIAI